MESTRENLAQALVTVVMFIALAMLGSALTGCNTTEGFGEDVEELGDSIDDAAEDAND
jgi:predicted small secreted protein